MADLASWTPFLESDDYTSLVHTWKLVSYQCFKEDGDRFLRSTIKGFLFAGMLRQKPKFNCRSKKELEKKYNKGRPWTLAQFINFQLGLPATKIIKVEDICVYVLLRKENHLVGKCQSTHFWQIARDMVRRVKDVSHGSHIRLK